METNKNCPLSPIQQASANFLVGAPSLSALRYNLPESSIAKYPALVRGTSRLLVFNNEVIDSEFVKLSDFLPPSSMLVFNNTKVINARIEFKKSSGTRIEVFCLEPHLPKEITASFACTTGVVWSCLVGNLKRWKENEILYKRICVNQKEIVISAKLLERSGKSNLVQLEWDDDLLHFSEILECLGTLPIPPYLNRVTEVVDNDRYQTVYSHHKGSVAAPTAGLHFTQSLLSDLETKGHDLQYVTLHVGAGTFKPIKNEDVTQHEMHEELFVVNKRFVETLLGHNGKLVAVGTTSVRTIESLYWLGYKLLNGDADLNVSQWYSYSNESSVSKEESLTAVLNYMLLNNLQSFDASTSIMIAPGYKFKIVDVIITNFHQPESSLLLLVSAFIGYENCMNIYAHAIQNGYKFLSYGDSSLLFPNS